MTVLTNAYATNLTLTTPSFDHYGDESLPSPDLPPFDEILCFGTLIRAAATPPGLCRRFLWQGSLLDAAGQESGIVVEQAAAFTGLVWQQTVIRQVSATDGAYIQIQTGEVEHPCGGLTGFYRYEG